MYDFFFVSVIIRVRHRTLDSKGDIILFKACYQDVNNCFTNEIEINEGHSEIKLIENFCRIPMVEVLLCIGGASPVSFILWSLTLFFSGVRKICMTIIFMMLPDRALF